MQQCPQTAFPAPCLCRACRLQCTREAAHGPAVCQYESFSPPTKSAALHTTTDGRMHASALSVVIFPDVIGGPY